MKQIGVQRHGHSVGSPRQMVAQIVEHAPLQIRFRRAVFASQHRAARGLRRILKQRLHRGGLPRSGNVRMCMAPAVAERSGSPLILIEILQIVDADSGGGGDLSANRTSRELASGAEIVAHSLPLTDPGAGFPGGSDADLIGDVFVFKPVETLVAEIDFTALCPGDSGTVKSGEIAVSMQFLNELPKHRLPPRTAARCRAAPTGRFPPSASAGP